MGKINVLDFEIANLIAAGEVVERPSSVLKELIENSIDSGATSIVAEIKRGGVALIRVSDNGCGMDSEDLPVAIKRHATSKIRDREDLDGIITLGFRGEALAAISSVSRITIITKTKEAESGSMLTSEGGKIIDVSEVGCADGTTVVVEDLFYNVPARRKFLKKDSTEAMNCAALVERVALSRPDISIQLLSDGVERFKTPGDNDILNTIYAIYGKEFSSKLILADGEANGIRVHGYVGRSDNVKKNRNLENFFINGRYVKSLTAMAAVEKAFTSYIAPEAFPCCVLFIDINPQWVDVNVHPAKLEVKFANEQPVFEAIYYTVKRAIEDFEYRPEMVLSEKPKSERNSIGAFVPIGADTKGEQISLASSDVRKHSAIEPVIRSIPSTVYSKIREREEPRTTPRAYDPIDISRPQRAASGAVDGFKKSYESHSDNNSLTPKSSVELLKKYSEARPSSIDVVSEKIAEEPAPIVESAPVVEPSIEKNLEYKLVGEAFNCYIFVEYEGELWVIDKHAAHERVIFEDLKRMSKADGAVASQSLLLPVTVLLSPDEIATADSFKSDFLSVGFDFNVNSSSIDVVAIPSSIGTDDAESLFVKMIDELREGCGNPSITEEIRREKALYQIACKAAIKGGRVYDESVTRWLVEKLLSLPDVIVCPHGRPVAFKMTKGELDRQFDRIK